MAKVPYLIQHPNFYRRISTIPVPAPPSSITKSSTFNVWRCGQSPNSASWTLHFVKVNNDGIHPKASTLQRQPTIFNKLAQNSRCSLVIISITRYRDIDRGFIQRTISWRAYIVRYRARTHVSRVLCSHTAAAASASNWCRSPCTLSVAPSASHSLR